MDARGPAPWQTSMPAIEFPRIHESRGLSASTRKHPPPSESGRASRLLTPLGRLSNGSRHAAPESSSRSWLDPPRAGRAIRARDALAASLAHDLRTPLTSIALNCDVCLRVGGDTAELERRIRSIRAAAERATRMIGDLLEAAAIDAGRLELSRRVEDVQKLVTEAVDLFQPLALEKFIAIVLEPAPSPSPRSYCDRERIIRALSNVIGNAVKFTPAGGKVSVRVESTDEKTVHLSVADSGPGIAPHELERVFDRGFQAEPEKKSAGGLGLGLAIARGIVQAHGGRIWAERRHEGGSRLSFTLPRAADAGAIAA